jgi:hypothetical protein
MRASPLWAVPLILDCHRRCATLNAKRDAKDMKLDDDVETALALSCEELQMTREELIRLIIREWLQGYGSLPINDLDEGSETEGSA